MCIFVISMWDHYSLEHQSNMWLWCMAVSTPSQLSPIVHLMQHTQAHTQTVWWIYWSRGLKASFDRKVIHCSLAQWPITVLFYGHPLAWADNHNCCHPDERQSHTQTLTRPKHTYTSVRYWSLSTFEGNCSAAKSSKLPI